MNALIENRRVSQKSKTLSQQSSLPPRSKFLCWGAERYLLHGFGLGRGFLAQHFNAIRISRTADSEIDPQRPLVFYLNHPSWWDPLTAFAIARHIVPDRYPCAPIERTALRRYPLLDRLGLFGVDASPSGTRTFIETAAAVASHPETSLWLTPEGRFTNPRERPLRFRRGIGCLAKRIDGLFVPVAIDYQFHDQPRPEILVHLGAPIDSASESLSAGEWTARFEDSLTVTLDRFTRDSLGRDDCRFQKILSGGGGVVGAYGFFRRVVAATARQS